MNNIIKVVIIGLLLGTFGQAATQQAPYTPLAAALSRVPVGDWQSISFTDYTLIMGDLGQPWPPEGFLSADQQQGWDAAWKPTLFNEDLSAIGFSTTHVRQAVQAQDAEGEFVLWLQGDFDPITISENLTRAFFQPLPATEFSAEAYSANSDTIWGRRIPYIALPDGETLLIATSLEGLSALLNVYDGLAASALATDSLLATLTAQGPTTTSAVLRFDQGGSCAVSTARIAAHGLRYDVATAHWQYILNFGFNRQATVREVRAQADALEYSTLRVPSYPGVFGQHTSVQFQGLHENPEGRILQFVLKIHEGEGMPALPIVLAQQPDACETFQVPAAAALSLALTYLPDLSGNQATTQIRFGSAEQALYNAGITDWQTPLDPNQRIALNSTWRTSLAFEESFPNWFGFPASAIRQTAEITMSDTEYVRVIWGDFTAEQVEAALSATGYVPIEQYTGSRIFTLRDVPNAGGVLLSRLTQNAATVGNGILLFANTPANMRLALDTITQNFRSALLNVRDLTLTAQALGDTTNATIRRYITPVSGGLVCGTSPFRIEGFANVRRADGWHFIYALGTNRLLEDAEEEAIALGAALEESDYPLQGPGSATFGDLSTVIETRAIVEGSTSVLVVELLVNTQEQEASFFGQELPTASLPPCALGDIIR